MSQKEKLPERVFILDSDIGCARAALDATEGKEGVGCFDLVENNKFPEEIQHAYVPEAALADARREAFEQVIRYCQGEHQDLRGAPLSEYGEVATLAFVQIIAQCKYLKSKALKFTQAPGTEEGKDE